MATTSTTSTMSLPASLSSAVAAASSFAANPEVRYSPLTHMYSQGFNVWAYSQPIEQTACYRKGALPIALAFNDTCLLGFHCPRSNNRMPPQYCHPTDACAVMRSNQKTCNPQGLLEPKICANGHYCPPGGKEEIPCPAGTFCPSGSYKPQNCSLAALCPEQSVRQIDVLPLYLTLVVDLILLLIVGVGFGISRHRKRKPKEHTTLAPSSTEKSGGADLLLEGKPSVRGHSPSISVSRPQEPSPVASIHGRRSQGRVDHLDGYADDDILSLRDEDVEDDLQNSPDMQEFIRSMSKTVETSSIGLSFDFENLSYETKRGKKILQGITGTMPRGTCWGIMGGSGAGKSTFVNVLMGKAVATRGTVKINGHQKDMSKYKKLIGYVPQDDIVFPELTVRENILHSARVRLPSRWKDKTIQDHVDALIACLQLTHVQHNRVGDAVRPMISGGQRKRVNIGMELAAAPMAIFLDEPTSGLDATSAASIMRLLRAISRLGVTTIAIIHQPREQIFYGFDQLLLLSQGCSVYNGPTEGVQPYFENIGYALPQRANPADTLIDIITGDGSQYITNAAKQDTGVTALIEHWREKGQCREHVRHLSTGLDGTVSKQYRRISTQSTNSTEEQEEQLRRTMKARGATWAAQVYYCWKRAMTQQVRNSTSFFFEIAVGGLAGVIIGLSAFASNGHLFQGIYHPPFTILSSATDYYSTPQIGLLGAMAIGLAASAPGFWVFGEEKLMYWRETAAGHSRSAYYVGKLLSTIVRIALSSLHFTVFVGVLATPLISFQAMYAANLTYFWCIYGLASVVSMCVKREDGPLLAVLASLVIGILGGVAPPLSKVKSWHMEWFWRLSPGVWFTEAYFTENISPTSYLYATDLAAEVVGFTLGQYGLDIGMLFMIGIVYRLVAYAGLILIRRDRQR